MKKGLLWFCLLALLATACKPDPEPGLEPVGGETNDTTETVVKKYLSKQLLNDDPEKIVLAIDWNEDCSRIIHVKYGLGYGSLVDYDFNYYGNDSVCIVPSLQPFSYPLWSLWYDSVMLHLNENRIDSISCYVSGTVVHTEHYYYDKDKKLIKRSFLFGTNDSFRWEGDNVIEANMYGRNYEYVQFTDYIHPHYNLPFYLSNFVAAERFEPLFVPLWKNQPISESFEYEADEDNYVVKAKSTQNEIFYSYQYIKKP